MVVSSPVGGIVLRCSVVWLLGAAVWGKDTPPAPPPPSSSGVVTALSSAVQLPLEQVLPEIRMIEAGLAKKVEALRAEVDAEVSAKRLVPQQSEGLLWSLRSAIPSSGADFNSLIYADRLPTDNAKIMDALRTLNEEWTAGQQKRNALLQAALTEARRRTGEVAHQATKVEDIDPLLATLDRLQEASQGRTPHAETTLTDTHSFGGLAAFLRILRRVIETSAEGDPVNIGSALSLLQSTSFAIRGVVSDAEIRERVQTGTAPFLKAVDETQSALDKALAEKKPAAALATALTNFITALWQSQQVRVGSNVRISPGSASNAGTSDVYRNLVGIAAALQSNDYAQARSLMESTHGVNLQQLGTARSTAYAAQIAAWEKALNEQKQEAFTKRHQEIAARLDAIKTAADLEALATDLAAKTNGRGEERDDAWPRSLGPQLNALAALWNGGNPQRVRQSTGDNAEARFTTELDKLRQHIERDLLARSLNAPELLKPPLGDLPTDTALDKLAAQLCANRDWRRLLQVTNVRLTQNQFVPVNSLDVDLATALRAFLAGQNMELAEQWTDAVQSYKSVLRCIDERAPTRETAERLKAISKNHPEAFSPPAVNPPVPAGQ